MVSDSEIVSRLWEFLKTSDLNTTTTTIVRRRLEEDFGIDLSGKKAFIREQVDLFLQSQFDNSKENEEEQEVQEEEVEEDDEDEEGKVIEEKEDSDNQAEEEVKEEASAEEEGSSGTSKPEKVKKRGGGFCKLCSLSPQLQEFTGVPEMARTEVVKNLWAHIREKGLQDPSNRRIILCDEPFRALFKVDSIDMFKMNKALSKHIWPLDSDDVVPTKCTQTEKRQKQESEEDEDELNKKGKKQKGETQKRGTTGFLRPLQLSDALVKFFGTGDNEMSRSEVIKRLWEYIRQNKLQDPSDKRRIICDEKLKELFDVESFIGFTVAKLLTAHLTKIE